MSAFNALMRALFDGMLAPFRGFPAIVGLLPISILFSVVALLAFKWTSNQEKLERVKDKIAAGIFEIRLFNDDLGAIFRAQGRIFWQVLRQLGLIVVPLLWMVVPFAIIVPQLQFHYGYEGFAPGESFLLEAKLAGAPPQSDDQGFAAELPPKPDVELIAPPGVVIETPPVWVPSLNEVSWRLSIAEEGTYEVEIKGPGGATTTKSLVSSPRVIRRSPKRPDRSFFQQVAYPAESPLPAGSPFEEITVRYPDTKVWLLGWHTHWLIVFLILTVIIAFALRKPLGVTF